MKPFFRTLLATFTSIVIFFLLVLIIVSIATSEKEPEINDNSYLVIDIQTALPEYLPPMPFPAFADGEPESLHRIISNLNKVTKDDRIDGIILRINGMAYTDYPATIGEIHHAIEKCQDAGKKVIAYATSLNRKSFELAAACDSIFITPGFYFDFVGMSAGSPFIKNMLDKIGIDPYLSKIKDYKSAAEIILEEKWTDAARENEEWLLDEQWSLFVDMVQEKRGLSEEQILEAMDYALFSGEEDKVIEMGLVDEVIYWDEVKERYNLDDEKKSRMVSSAAYAKVDPKGLGIKGKHKIAVIHAEGLIAGPVSGYNAFMGQTMGYETVCKQFDAALKDKKVRAIVFRVNSGGGDALTSEIIARKVEVADKKKPVVVSMVGVAASGGYHIAQNGRKIIANEGSYTGSIGSISGKFVTRDLNNKIGLNYDFVSKGPNAYIFSTQHPFTEEQAERHSDNHWKSFNHWLKSISVKRGIPMEKLSQLAEGRVWTGTQAKENGLIDELGGLDMAVEIAVEMAEIPADEKVTLDHYPKQKSLAEQIFSDDEVSVSLADYLLYKIFHIDLPKAINEVHSRNMMIWDTRLN